MIHFTKSLQISSTISAIVVGAAFMAGCTISTSPTDPALTPAPTPSSTVDGGSDGGPVVGSGCDFAEPNDTRESAKPIDLNTPYTSLCVSNPDKSDELDFFEITAPAADVAGGVVEVQVTNVKNDGHPEIIVTSVVDNGVIFDAYTVDRGANVSGWLTVTPGAKYRIQVNRFGGAGDRFAYDIVAKYTPIKDTYESNNKKEDAKAIEVNKPIEGSAAGHSAKADLEEGDADDWFKVTLGAGAATLKMTNVAADNLCDLQLFDANGVKVDEKYQVTPGADCIMAATELTGGSYFVKLNTFSGPPSRGEANKPVPAFLTQSYVLEVQQ
jgi:hypothetical protein